MKNLSVLSKLEKFLDSAMSDLSSEADFREATDALENFLDMLQKGELRAASKDSDGSWHVEPKVKQGILLAFRLSQIVKMGDDALPFSDKALFSLQSFLPEKRVRVVPGGSSVRRGAFVGDGVTIMPPAYINVGAFVGQDSMVDSHALIGSCAQVGQRVHVSAAAQIGGVLEPIGAMPVIVENDVLVGGNSGIYEGAIIGERAVIGAGVVLTASTRVFDLVNRSVIEAKNGASLEIPAGAVVVPGSRALKGEFAQEHALSVASPIIVKYRDTKTDSKTALEDSLRQ